jgi:hypothetical protein
MKKVLLGLALLAACGDDESEQMARTTPCEELREHLIDLRLAEASPKVDKEAHRVAMRGAFGDAFLSSCSHMSDENRSCALSATTLGDAMGCEPEGTK